MATHVEGTQSAETLDLRMGCMQRRLREARALADLLVEANAHVVEHAVELSANLGPLPRCGDVAPTAPGESTASMCMFKPAKGEPNTVDIAVRGPEASCSPSFGDTNGDGGVDVTDLLNVLGDWGCGGICIGDTTCDEIVNIDDLLDVLGNWTI